MPSPPQPTPPPNPKSIAISTNSAEETRRLAVAISPVLLPGDVLMLSGDLGAGKTTFVQGLAAGLGIPERVTSPTFILMKEYHGGRYPLMHMDVYRLGMMQEVIDLGYDEYLDPAYIVAVEWGDKVAPLLPKDHLQIDFRLGPHDSAREITLAPAGELWESRMDVISILVAELFSAGREADPGYFGEQFRPGDPPRGVSN